jgi:hypothetical protein
MLEDVLEVATLVEDVTGNSAPGSVFRNDCLHRAFRSRCQSGTGVRGASIRPPVSDVAEERSNTIDANPRLWLLVSGNSSHEHQTCIGLHLTTCLRAFAGSHSPVALEVT